MKYIFVKKNNPWNKNTGDVKHFESEAQRNEWVNTHLFDEGDDFISLLSSSKTYNNFNLNPIDNISVELDSSKDITGNSNMVITCDDDLSNIVFHHIEGSTKQTNQKMVNYDLKVSVWLTYINLFGKMNNFKLHKGHIPFNKYVNYSFESGDKKLQSAEQLTNTWKQNSGEDNIFILAYRKDRFQEPTNGTTNIILEDGESTITLPYQTLIAPIKRKTFNIEGRTITWDAEQLLNTLQTELADGLTYNIQIVNYQFVDIPNESDIDKGFFTSEDGYSLAFADGKGSSIGIWYPENQTGGPDNPIFGNYSICTLNSFFPFSSDIQVRNSYEFDISQLERKNDIELLDGVRQVEIEIENTKKFEFPLKFINEGKIKFVHNVIPSPTESTEFINWSNPSSLDEMHEGNTWSNDSELAVFTNQLQEYRANSPITSKLDYIKPIKGLLNPLNYLNPSTLIAGSAGAIGGELATYINLQNMKQAPEKVEGSINTYFKYIFARKRTKFILNTYEYIGHERDGHIENIFREGINIDNGLVIKSYNDIKRPKFNFMVVSNFEEANTDTNLPNQVIEEIHSALSAGVRIWNQEQYKDYDNKSSNGDVITS